MKLVFPNGEHSQVLLSHGVNRIGSAAEGAAVLTQAGILPVHCVIHITNAGANLQVAAGGGKVAVNGKIVTDIMGLRAGDQLAIGPVIAKYLVLEEAKSQPSNLSDDDSNATRVRQAVPKFVLRGVSGAVFGKTYPVTGPVVIGRAAECDISVPADEMSRRHALLRATVEGLSVEDLGSSNGTFINNKRIQQGFLRPNDELRLDAVRFILVAPGAEVSSPPSAAEANAPAVAALNTAHKAQMWASIMLTLAALAVIALLVLKR
jgi:pSer/pThr/pTyr-binding forkhead associated (FHA) protein